MLAECSSRAVRLILSENYGKGKKINLGEEEFVIVREERGKNALLVHCNSFDKSRSVSTNCV